MRCLIALLLVLAPAVGFAAETRSVAGRWRAEADPSGIGEADRWFARDLADTADLPGTLGPGANWYQYTLMIPGSWTGKRVSLVLERVGGTSRVWIDGQPVPGEQDSIVAPHVRDLGPLGAPGTKRLTVRVDPKGSPIAPSAGTAGGLFGAIEIRAVDAVSISSIRVDPDVEHKVVRVHVSIANESGSTARGTLSLAARDARRRAVGTPDRTEMTIEGQSFELVREVALGPDAKPWGPESPALLVLVATLTAEAGGAISRDESSARFGLRSIDGDRTALVLNGVRVPLDSGSVGPLRSLPDGSALTTGVEIPSLLRDARDRDLDLVTLPLSCATEHAFASADAAGVLLAIEPPRGSAPAETDALASERSRLLRQFGNHPSFAVLYVEDDDHTDVPLSERLRRSDGRHVFLDASRAP